jgi:hypothetical protein
MNHKKMKSIQSGNRRINEEIERSEYDGPYRTKDMCTPRDRWTPLQLKQIKMPWGMEAHVGLMVPQSTHVLLWLRNCLKICAVSSWLAVWSPIEGYPKRNLKIVGMRHNVSNFWYFSSGTTPPTRLHCGIVCALRWWDQVILSLWCLLMLHAMA